MASDSYPRPDNNDGIVTESMYEQLAAPQAPDGLIGLPTDPPLVYADGVGTRTVRVRSNRRGLVRGFMYYSGAEDIPIVLPANSSGSTRVDLVVLRLTRATWRVQETYVLGTPGAGAPSPVNDAFFFDMPVAQVSVASGATSLAADRVTPVGWYLGSDGHIVCTSKSRPPAEPGRRVYETDTGRSLISAGASKWLIQAEDSGLLTLSMASGWGTAFNSLQRRNGFVFLGLSVQRTGGNIAADKATTVATLPEGFRPARTFESVCHAPSSGLGHTVLYPSGVLEVFMYEGINKDRFINFNPMTFPAA